MARIVNISREDFRIYAKKVYNCVMSGDLSVTFGMIQTAYREPQSLIFRKEDGTTFLLEEKENVPKEGEQEIFSRWLFNTPGGTFYVMPEWVLEGGKNVA